MPAAGSRRRSVDELFDRPLHPYTRGLMGAAPRARRIRGARRAAHRNPRHGAAASGTCRRLPLRAALPAGLDALPRGAPALGRKDGPATSPPAGSTPMPSDDHARRCSTRRGPQGAFPDPRGRASAAGRRRAAPSTASASTSTGAKRWGSSASSAAASRRPASR